MSRPLVVAALGGLAVLLAAAIWFNAQSRQVDGGDATRARAPAAPSAPQLSGSASAPASVPGSAPWANASPGAAAPTAANAAKAREVEAMQAELAASLRAGVAPDPRKVDATLAKIEALNGSSVVSGVNLDAVRTNLAIAGKLQAIGAEMEAESKKGGQMDNDRLRVLVAQVQQLQSQMRADVSAPPQPATSVPQPATKP